jgi:copper chaperone CopZ
MAIETPEATAVFKIQGMNSPGRAQRLKHAADKLDGVLRVDIDYILDTATVKYNPEKLTLAQVRKGLGPSNRA